ncbi:MAG: translation initiation factor IF-2 [Candidatus Kapabacteria bacterium]|nr:translation initiation factor IF-2 [Candidatus Kapabacteria bacterium]
MAVTDKTKLFKLASEINIGRDSIVDFLKSKGFEIENKPTAVLTEEMVDLVMEKFKKEKKAADTQRQKLEKYKSPKKPVEAKDKVEEKIIQDLTIDIMVEKEKVVPQKDLEIIFDLPPQKEAEKYEEAEKVTAKELKKEPEERKIPSEKKEKPETHKKDTKVKKEIQKPLEETKEEVIGIEIEKAPELPPTEEKEPSISIEEKVAEEIPVQEEVQKIAEKGEKRKKKKKKKIVEVEYDDGETLIKKASKGLTIIGKIDLDEIKKPVKAKKPVEDEDLELIEERKTELEYDSIKKKYKIKGRDRDAVKDKVIVDKRRKKKKSLRETISKDEIDRAIKETLTGISEAGLTAKRTKIKQKKKAEREEKELKRIEELERESKKLQLSEFVTTGDLANLMKVSPNEIIKKCFDLGLFVTINQRLDKDTITLIADDYGIEVSFLDEKELQVVTDEDDPEETKKPRPPIVTIMGHVDHGKTSLLDYIRNTNVVAGEAGGITQHIGAYQVELPNGKFITFLDTPGHEAFTAMRARGALVTDIVVLVVAADDSVMPQTVEAISHAQAANVPIIVAINKIDKPDANPTRIKQQLSDHNILVEEWGGKYQSVEISSKRGDNIDLLLEKILLEAELLDLKARYDRKAVATVIEANLSKGLGPVATVIVQKGTLKIHDNFVAGHNSGRVRNMFDERGNKVTEATPSMPVMVIGFDGLPEAGDILTVVDSEQQARMIASQRRQMRREQEFKQIRHVTLDDISKQIQIGGVRELLLILKCDVAGTIEALADSLIKLSRDEVKIQIIHKGVGDINESDVMLAYASGAVIIGFQVGITSKAKKLAETESVDIRIYNIIYDCINEIKLALEGLLTPEIKEDITATVEIRKVYKISKVGNIAGCYVLNGKISRNDKVRVLRDGFPIFNGHISSLKRGKDDVKEVDTGFECGISLDGFNGIEVGDIIEGYKVIEMKRKIY